MLVFQSCPTLCYSLNCSLPGSSVPGILQARMLECIAIPSSRESSWTRDQTRVSCNKCQSWVSNSNSLALELELLTWHCRAPPVSLLGHLGVTGARASIRRQSMTCSAMRGRGTLSAFSVSLLWPDLGVSVENDLSTDLGLQIPLSKWAY